MEKEKNQDNLSKLARTLVRRKRKELFGAKKNLCKKSGNGKKSTAIKFISN